MDLKIKIWNFTMISLLYKMRKCKFGCQFEKSIAYIYLHYYYVHAHVSQVLSCSCLIIDGPIMPTFIYQMTIYSRQSPPTTLYWLTVTPTPFFIYSRLKPPFYPRAFILYSKPLFIMSTMAEYSSSYINMPRNTFFTIACFNTQEHFKEMITKDQQDLYKSLHN